MKSAPLMLLALLILAHASSSEARPEIIKPGICYYAEDYVENKGVHDIAEEKNYEEVFKNYEYFETQYDASKRVILFRHYKQGDVVWEEKYAYHGNGKLARKEVIKEGKPAEKSTFAH